MLISESELPQVRAVDIAFLLFHVVSVRIFLLVLVVGGYYVVTYALLYCMCYCIPGFGKMSRVNNGHAVP